VPIFYADAVYLLRWLKLRIIFIKGGNTPSGRRAKASGKTLKQATLSLGSNGGKDGHTSGCYHAYHPLRRRIADRLCQRRRLGERALEEYALEPARGATERQQEPVRHHRIFVVVSAKPIGALLDRVVLLLITADRATL
jgi:hypothetical protein